MPSKVILLRRFGRQLRSFRKQRMISREEMGCRISLSAKDVEALEDGKEDPTLSTLVLIADTLNVPPEELLAPLERRDSEYYAYRFYLLKLLNRMSKKDLKKAIEALHTLNTSRRSSPPSSLSFGR